MMKMSSLLNIYEESLAPDFHLQFKVIPIRLLKNANEYLFCFRSWSSQQTTFHLTPSKTVINFWIFFLSFLLQSLFYLRTSTELFQAKRLFSIRMKVIFHTGFTFSSTNFIVYHLTAFPVIISKALVYFGWPTAFLI